MSVCAWSHETWRFSAIRKPPRIGAATPWHQVWNTTDSHAQPLHSPQDGANHAAPKRGQRLNKQSLIAHAYFTRWFALTAQDEAYAPPELDYGQGGGFNVVNSWMPLQAVTVDSGCMQFVPWGAGGQPIVLPHHQPRAVLPTPLMFLCPLYPSPPLWIAVSAIGVSAH